MPMLRRVEILTDDGNYEIVFIHAEKQSRGDAEALGRAHAYQEHVGDTDAELKVRR